jgi:hypothetical protein
LGSNQVFHPASINEDGVYHSTVIPNFWLNLDWLWQENLPNPQLALAEIMLSIEGLSPEAKDAFQAMHKLLTGKS